MAALSTFIIAGGTGRQGGATIIALLNDPISPVHPSKIYAITRNPDSKPSQSLAAQGVHLIKGDLADPTAIFASVRSHGASLSETGAYLAQAHGPQELQQAKSFIDAAAAAGIAYLVYSSVDRGGRAASDRDPSFCKTFSDKYLIEKHLIATAAASASANTGMDYTILRPTWFADNALWGFPGRLCMTGWRDRLRGKRLQVTCVADIGRWAAAALLLPPPRPMDGDDARDGNRELALLLRNQALSIASDELTFAEADAIFRDETGQQEGGIAVANGWLAWLLIWVVKDLRTMFAWIDERAYGADLEALGKVMPPTSFRAWVRKNAPVAKKAA